MRRLLSIATAASLIAAGLAAAIPGATAASPSVVVSRIKWGTCAAPSLMQVHAQCGFVSVPLDYSKPYGTQIQLAVSRIKHTAGHSQGVILTNPGGPGGSGLKLNVVLVAALQKEGFKAAAADYDWIGFDPRGVGSTKPAAACIPNYFSADRPGYVPRTKALLHFWLSDSKAYAHACGTHSALQSGLLKNMTTVDSARDMDSIRTALGQGQITYYGYSYGTYLGQVYATLFPSHVRRIILDSNVNPLQVWYQANLDQDVAFNRNIGVWFGWLAKYNSVYHLGSTKTAVTKLFYTTEAKLAASPAGGVVGPDEWVDTFLQAGYYEQTWLQLGQVFSDWINKHDAAAAKKLISLYKTDDTPGNDNQFAVYLAVECTDAQWPHSWARWSRDNNAIFRKAPFETWGNAWFNAPCIYWPAASSRPVKVHGGQIHNALLIDETLDAATPFGGSLKMRKLFPHSVLLAEPGGTTHADSLSGNLCVDSTIAAYLTSGTLPERNPNAAWDKTCKPLPVPVPPSAATTAPATRTPGQAAFRPIFLPALPEAERGHRRALDITERSWAARPT